MTGLSIMSVELGAKRLGLLREVVPGALRVAALINPKSSIAESLIRDTQAGASALGWQVEIVHASTNSEIDAAFAGLGKRSVDAVFISADQFFASRRVQFDPCDALSHPGNLFVSRVSRSRRPNELRTQPS